VGYYFLGTCNLNMQGSGLFKTAHVYLQNSTQRIYSQHEYRVSHLRERYLQSVKEFLPLNSEFIERFL